MPPLRVLSRPNTAPTLRALARPHRRPLEPTAAFTPYRRLHALPPPSRTPGRSPPQLPSSRARALLRPTPSFFVLSALTWPTAAFTCPGTPSLALSSPACSLSESRPTATLAPPHDRCCALQQPSPPSPTTAALAHLTAALVRALAPTTALASPLPPSQALGRRRTPPHAHRRPRAPHRRPRVSSDTLCRPLSASVGLSRPTTIFAQSSHALCCTPPPIVALRRTLPHPRCAPAAVFSRTTAGHGHPRPPPSSHAVCRVLSPHRRPRAPHRTLWCPNATFARRLAYTSTLSRPPPPSRTPCCPSRAPSHAISCPSRTPLCAVVAPLAPSPRHSQAVAAPPSSRGRRPARRDALTPVSRRLAPLAPLSSRAPSRHRCAPLRVALAPRAPSRRLVPPLTPSRTGVAPLVAPLSARLAPPSPRRRATVVASPPRPSSLHRRPAHRIAVASLVMIPPRPSLPVWRHVAPTPRPHRCVAVVPLVAKLPRSSRAVSRPSCAPLRAVVAPLVAVVAVAAARRCCRRTPLAPSCAPLAPSCAPLAPLLRPPRAVAAPPSRRRCAPLVTSRHPACRVAIAPLSRRLAPLVRAPSRRRRRATLVASPSPRLSRCCHDRLVPSRTRLAPSCAPRVRSFAPSSPRSLPLPPCPLLHRHHPARRDTVVPLVMMPSRPSRAVSCPSGALRAPSCRPSRALHTADRSALALLHAAVVPLCPVSRPFAPLVPFHTAITP
ncbi:hypothetical protein DENSPDRAFT_934274 [Dentipellis sp. KUC8613]|nr:hypothetical protein DENSPDRAFT_934274 [Dentipellis sp. KUC8613]